MNSYACNDRDSNNRDHTPSKSYNESFNVYSVQSSAKKPQQVSSVHIGGAIPFCLDKADKSAMSNLSGASSFLSNNADLMQSKIEHLERERVELTMQLHRKDEKDRDRKLKLEQMEFKFKSAEEERQKLNGEVLDLRDQVYRIQCEKDDLTLELQRLQIELHNSNRCEAMDVWKKMTATARELKRVEEEHKIVCNERDALQQEHKALIEEVESLRSTVIAKEADLQELLARWEEQREQQEEQMKSLNKQLEDIKDSLEESREQRQANEEQYLLQISQLEEEKAHLQECVEKACHASNQTESVPLAQNNQEAAAYEQIIQELKDKLFESENKRRTLHNTVQDLKGHVRVYVRCRPLLPSDGETSASLVTLHQDHSTVSIASNNNSNRVASNHTFAFDHTFDGDSSQEEVFDEVSSLVQSVLDGYRVCIFSYGQTGSGKTFTMTGDMAGGQRGIIPRSIEQLLAQSRHLMSSGWNVQLQISILEIYNEEVRDLLCNYGQSSSTCGQKIKIFKNAQTNKVMLAGVNTFDLPCADRQNDATSDGLDVFKSLFDYAVQARSTAQTGMNATSSRSHFIVLVDVLAQSPASSKSPSITLQGGLRLCDLAGSERLDRANTAADAARLKETVHINKSLSCLADVFLALSHKANHVPFRNSKLTTLLQDCLSGDGKAMMFVNISPTSLSTQETLCSLRFANQVSQVELGKAQRTLFTAPVTTISNGAPAANGSASIFPNANSASMESTSLDTSNDYGRNPSVSQTQRTIEVASQNVSVASISSPLRSAGKRERSRSPLPFRSGGEDEGKPNGQSEKIQNRPLPMVSFLSGNGAGPSCRIGGIGGGALRNVGSSRRMSTLVAPRSAPAPVDASMQSKMSANQMYNDGMKENDLNKPVPRGLLISNQSTFLKREMPCTNQDGGALKRYKSQFDIGATNQTRKFTWR
eukprot:gene2592-2835_t